MGATKFLALVCPLYNIFCVSVELVFSPPGWFGPALSCLVCFFSACSTLLLVVLCRVALVVAPYNGSIGVIPYGAAPCLLVMRHKHVWEASCPFARYLLLFNTTTVRPSRIWMRGFWFVYQFLLRALQCSFYQPSFFPFPLCTWFHSIMDNYSPG